MINFLSFLSFPVFSLYFSLLLLIPKVPRPSQAAFLGPPRLHFSLSFGFCCHNQARKDSGVGVEGILIEIQVEWQGRGRGYKRTASIRGI